jgi:hypothetical protein
MSKAPTKSKPKATPLVVAPPSNKSLALIDQELNQEIANIKESIGSPGGGKQIKVEPSGNFILPDGANLGDEIHLIIVDFSTRKSFYSQPFDRNNPTPPDCYAIGKVIKALAPDDSAIPAKQHDNCAECPLNQWGSGNGGNGKACREFRDLAVLVVDPENPDAHNEPDAPIYLLSVPPTSLKAFDGFVPLVARSLAGPPIKAIVTVKGTAVGTYATLSFTNPVPNPDYAAHAARRAETIDLLNRRPDYAGYQARPQPARRGAVPARTVARPAPRSAAGGRR